MPTNIAVTEVLSKLYLCCSIVFVTVPVLQVTDRHVSLPLQNSLLKFHEVSISIYTNLHVDHQLLARRLVVLQFAWWRTLLHRRRQIKLGCVGHRPGNSGGNQNELYKTRRN